MIDNNFDKDQVSKEVDLQIAVMKEFDTNSQKFKTKIIELQDENKQVTEWGITGVTAASLAKDLSKLVSIIKLSRPVGIGSVATRINIRNGSADKVGSGLDYAWKKHGGEWGNKNKSYFIISKEDVKSLLKNKSVINSPAYKPTSGNYVRMVDVNNNIGFTKIKGKSNLVPTSKMTIITDEKGNLVNVFHGILKNY